MAELDRELDCRSELVRRDVVFGRTSPPAGALPTSLRDKQSEGGGHGRSPAAPSLPLGAGGCEPPEAALRGGSMGTGQQ